MIKRLELTNFRNYISLSLDLPPGLIILQGDNAQGKTNFLEAIYLLATTRSPFSKTDQEFVNWLAQDSPLPFAKIAGVIEGQDGSTRIELVIAGEPSPSGVRYRKKAFINGVPKRLIDILGRLCCVLFSPSDIEIVSGPPEGRRRFLDIALCQVDSKYCQALALYNKVVERRNHLLKRAQEEGFNEEEFLFWDESLVKYGSIVTKTRWEALETMAPEVRKTHMALTEAEESLQVLYICSALGEVISDPGLANPPSLEEIEKAMAQRLAQARSKDLDQGVTTIGPHRDDVRFLLNGRDISTYGSRGQQRSAAFSLRLAEMTFIEKASGESPLLLLDEVLSELDQKRRERLTEIVSQAPQAIITTLEWGGFRKEFLAKAHLFTVTQGNVRAVSLSSIPTAA